MHLAQTKFSSRWPLRTAGDPCRVLAASEKTRLKAKTACAERRAPSSLHNGGHPGCGRRVAASLAAYDSVDHGHSDPRQVTQPYTLEQRFPCRMLRRIHKHKIGSPAHFD